MYVITLSTHRWRCCRCHAYGLVEGDGIAYLMATITQEHCRTSPECEGLIDVDQVIQPVTVE